MKDRLPNFVLQRFTKLHSSYNCNPITRKLVTSIPSCCLVLSILTTKMRQTLSVQHIQTRFSLIRFWPQHIVRSLICFLLQALITEFE